MATNKGGQDSPIVYTNNTLLPFETGTSEVSDEPRANTVSNPLSSQLSNYVRDNFLQDDRVKLRDHISSRLPPGVLENIPNDVDIFDELINRGLLGDENFDFIREVSWEIGRTDLVHLIDCIKEGDYSLLDYEVMGEQSSSTNFQDYTRGSTSEDRSPEGHRSSEGHADDARSPSTAASRAPRASPVSPEYAAQATVSDTTWIENPEFSCEHYDRHCDFQFGCCEAFWPCHRCHNSNSSCGTTVDSRDIKQIRCKRCRLIQQFPKNSPHCARCNIMFAEYFCAICQRLTGTQNHPFHCEKCGTCRRHGDRSFHCDVCGRCLHVNLLGNHRCRVGSSHDECPILFEASFSGCQILPGSHNVRSTSADERHWTPANYSNEGENRITRFDSQLEVPNRELQVGNPSPQPVQVHGAVSDYLGIPDSLDEVPNPTFQMLNLQYLNTPSSPMDLDTE